MDTMTPTDGTQEQLTTHIQNRLAKLDETMSELVRGSLRTNDAELQVRMERAKKAAAERGSDLETLLDEAASADQESWPEVRERLEAAWLEYKETVERARLELERGDELS